MWQKTWEISGWVKSTSWKFSRSARFRRASTLGVILIALMFGPTLQAHADDIDLSAAYDAFNTGDDDLAFALLDKAEAAAGTAADRWTVAEARATFTHLGEQDEEAVAALQPLIDEGEAIFGEDSPRLIPALRMVGASLGVLGEDAASTRALGRAVRIGRIAGTAEDLLIVLSDFARDRIDTEDSASAALMAAEMVIRDTAEDGTIGRYAQEGAALWALALLRAGYPDDALARLMPLLRVAPDAMAPDASDILAVFEDEAHTGDDAATAAWFARATAREAAHAAADTSLTSALEPMAKALAAGDAPAADAAGRAALDTVAADDPLVSTSYFALLLACQKAGLPDCAAPWALRLGGMPAAYLATLDYDPLPPLEKAADWILNQGRLNEGIELSEALVALAPLREGPKGLPVGRALARLGAAYRDAGRLGDAEATLNRALATTETPPQGKEAALSVQVWADLALLARDRKRPIAAQQAYSAALTILQQSDEGSGPEGWAFILAEQRSFELAEGRPEDALAVSRRAVEEIASRSAGTTPLLLTALRDQAASELATIGPEAALATLDRAAPGLATFAADDPILVRMGVLRASALYHLGRGAEADAILKSAVDTQGRRNDLTTLIGVMEAASAAQAAGDGNTARRLMTGAFSALPEAHPMRAYILVGRAVVEDASGATEAALADLREATAILTQPDRRSERGARDHLPLHMTLALREAERTEGTAALNLTTEAFQVAQRVNDLSAGASLGRATARLRGDGTEATALARRLDSANATLTAARTTLYARIADGVEAGAEARAVDAARASLDATTADLAATFPAYAAFADPRPVDILSTAALLAPDEVLVLYASADQPVSGAGSPGTVFAITHDGFLTASLPPRAELAALARDLRCAAALTDRACGGGAYGTRGAFSLDAPGDRPAFDLDLAHRAWLALLAPVAGALQGKRSLIVVPDRTLASLPFPLLLTEEAAPDTPLPRAPWLIRRMAVTVVPTVAGLAALRGKDARPSTATEPFLGIGDPLIGAARNGPLPYDCDASITASPLALALASATGPILRGGVADAPALAAMAALPDTRCELARMAALFGTPEALILQGEATETRIKAMSASGDLERYRVLTFATHGLIAGELGQANAGLVLTPPRNPDAEDDGLLTTSEIAGLRLDADFVLLSACNSAAGSADAQEGLSGLASAFFLAGARSLLVSHWPVYSDAATRLTSGMIAALETDPRIGRAEALQRSMLAILDDADADARMIHPAYWAPFLIAGDGAGR